MLRTLRTNRELFQILLEHFVYDPLIDWKSQFGTHESTLVPLYVINPVLAAQCSKQRRNLEMDATFDLFKLRTSEIGPDWSASKAELESVIAALDKSADSWIALENRIERLHI